MEEEILKLLFDYSIKGKTSYMAYIDKLVEILVDGMELQNEVNSLEKREKYINNTTVATYERDSKRITICYDNLKSYLTKREEDNSIFNILERRIFLNALVTQIVLHEVMHAVQSKIVSMEKYETDLMKNFIIKMTSKLDYNEDTYNICPKERFAEIDSYKYLYSLLSLVKVFIPTLIDYVKGAIIRNTIRGYDKTNSPTITFAKEAGTKAIEAKFISSYMFHVPHLSFEERAYCGLPLTNEEIQNLYNLYNETEISKSWGI